MNAIIYVILVRIVEYIFIDIDIMKFYKNSKLNTFYFFFFCGGAFYFFELLLFKTDTCQTTYTIQR